MAQAPGNARRAQLAVIRGASTRVQVFNELREDIVSVALKPGGALSEKELAERYGVSRTPVREAILRLVDEGLLEVVPQHGTFVSRISVGDVREMQFVRESLELAGLPDTIRLVQPADGVLLHEILDGQLQAERDGDVRRWFQLDEDLHRSLLEIGGRYKVWPIVCSAKAHLDRVRMLSLPTKRALHERYLEHKLIVEHVLSGDLNGAAAVMRPHLEGALEVLNNLKVAQPDYFHDDPGDATPRVAAGVRS